MEFFFKAFLFVYRTHMAMAVQDDLLEVLEVRVVYEGPQIGAVGRRN